MLVYWPGIILGDTDNSIHQVFDLLPLTNHFPVLYTLYIKLCIKIGQFIFHSNTIGYALYTLSQMLFISACLTYMIEWIWRRGGVRKSLCILMVILFGLLPHFAAFSIAGWKDPAFSASIAAISVYLLNDILFPSEKKGAISRILYWLLLLIIAFIRNNGISILIFIACWQIGMLVYQYKRIRLRLILPLLTVSSILIWFFVTGPVYRSLEITSDRRESNALVLQQIARTGALSDHLSEENRKFLNEFLPTELYESTYRPCCVDLFKWNTNLNTNLMNSYMYKNWLSMFIKNPIIYFEAWELNSFGFWTLNVPSINCNTWNISGGTIRNTSNDYPLSPAFEIQFSNLLGNNNLRKYLPTDGWFIPLGWIFWGTLYLSLCLILQKRYRHLVALIPTFGLMFPLIFFTPIYYWVRYGQAMQYLLPLYLLLFRLSPADAEKAN